MDDPPNLPPPPTAREPEPSLPPPPPTAPEPEPSLPPPTAPPLPSMADSEVRVNVAALNGHEPPPPPPVPPLNGHAAPPPGPPHNGHAAPAHNIDDHPINLAMAMMVAGFCFQSAVTVAAQSLQNDDMLCLAMVVAVAAICVSNYISTNFRVVARALEHVGVLSGVTAFFIAVTVSSSLWLKIISWLIFAISILAVLVFNCLR